MKKPVLKINKIQSFFEFENNSGLKVRFGVEDKKLFVEVDEQKTFLTNNSGNFIANILSSSGIFDSVETDVLKLQTKTPVNAVAASGILTLTGAVSDGETVTIGDDVYEFDTNASVTAGNILVDVSAGATAPDAITALVSAITASGTEPITATDGAGDTVDIVADVKGTLANSIGTVTDCANGSFGAANLEGGVDGTIALANEIAIDSSYLYYAIAANTVSGTNWRRISLGTAY
jgi:hypothetical protein